MHNGLCATEGPDPIPVLHPGLELCRVRHAGGAWSTESGMGSPWRRFGGDGDGVTTA